MAELLGLLGWAGLGWAGSVGKTGQAKYRSVTSGPCLLAR